MARGSWSAGCTGTSGCWWFRWRPSPAPRSCSTGCRRFHRFEIGLGLMTVMTAVNLMSARSYAEFEFWFASIKVAAIIVFIVDRRLVRLRLDVAAWHHLRQPGPTSAGFAPRGWIAVLAAVPTVFFAMTGAEITTIAAAESDAAGAGRRPHGRRRDLAHSRVLRGLDLPDRLGHARGATSARASRRSRSPSTPCTCPGRPRS